MCKQIQNSRTQGLSADFILVTGDLAFSGKVSEYDLVAKFIDALCTASCVPKERVFCIPGNHDIDRNRENFVSLARAQSYRTIAESVPFLMEEIISRLYSNGKRIIGNSRKNFLPTKIGHRRQTALAMLRG